MSELRRLLAIVALVLLARAPLSFAQVRPSGIAAHHLLCAMVRGQARCMAYFHYFNGMRGENDNDSLRPIPGDPGLVNVRTSLGVVCGLTAPGRMYCMGMANDPHAGPYTTDSRTTLCGSVICSLLPTPVAGNYAFRSFALSDEEACGSTTSGTLVCWGAALRQARVPRVVPGAPAFVTMEAGNGVFCGLTAAGAAWCWDYNPTMPIRPHRVAAPHTFVAIAAGEMDGGMCGIEADGALWCSGADGAYPPHARFPALRFRTISMGHGFSCGVLVQGGAACWGENSDGELGIGRTWQDLHSSSEPVLVAGSEDFEEIAAGYEFAGARSRTGAVYYWGGCTCDASGFPRSFERPTLASQPAVTGPRKGSAIKVLIRQ